MKRRQMLSVVAGLAFSAVSGLVVAGMMFTPGMIKEDLAAGRTVLVDYKAKWCGTCASQTRVMAKLRAANPEYDKNIFFIDVDWDDYKNHEVTTSRNVPRRSTLILLKGDKELGRIVAGTSEKEIKALLDKAL